jgi:ketol-acid reductoisomerase
MRDILADVRSGAFAATLAGEAAADYPLLTAARADAAAQPVERARSRLMKLLGG